MANEPLAGPAVVGWNTTLKCKWKQVHKVLSPRAGLVLNREKGPENVSSIPLPALLGRHCVNVKVWNSLEGSKLMSLTITAFAEGSVSWGLASALLGKRHSCSE